MPVVLSENQKEILKLLTEEFLTAKQIANRRGKSTQAIYKTIKKLKEKGVLIRGLQNAQKKRGVAKSKGVANLQKIRLHNIQESIRILGQISKKYYKKLKQGNKLELSGLTVMLYNDNLQLFSQTGINFYGDTTDECDANAIEFFRKFIIKLENDYNITLEKDRVLNKKWVRRHYALTNSEIAKKANDNKERIIIYDKQDGKERVITDRSFNINEIETIHPIKNKPDMNKLKFHVTDLVENPSLSNSQITSRINDMLRVAEHNTLSISKLGQMIKILLDRERER